MPFIEARPTREDYWRSLILFGRNVGSYKFALAKSLLELASNEPNFVKLDELAAPFSRHIAEHLARVDKQVTSSSSRFHKHVELLDFHFGKRYIYTTKLVQFRDVYLPVFPSGRPETASNLQLLVWTRNDRNSNEPLIETRQELDRFCGRDQPASAAIHEARAFLAEQIGKFTIGPRPKDGKISFKANG
jgi:hypothetical protein